MSILTLLLLIVLMMPFRQVILFLQGKVSEKDQQKKNTVAIKAVGLFAFMFGLFTQLLGFYGAFIAVEIWGSVTENILLSGLFTSAIPSLYGLSIWLISCLAVFVLNRLNHRLMKA